MKRKEKKQPYRICAVLKNLNGLQPFLFFAGTSGLLEVWSQGSGIIGEGTVDHKKLGARQGSASTGSYKDDLERGGDLQVGLSQNSEQADWGLWGEENARVWAR